MTHGFSVLELLSLPDETSGPPPGQQRPENKTALFEAWLDLEPCRLPATRRVTVQRETN
jgi:hypothetical protein